MASFNSKSFEKKLKSLDASQTAIRTLSLWILHHRQFAKVIADSWLDQLKKAGKPEKRLNLFYLANDVVQNGRKKAKDLLYVLGDAFKEAMGLLCDEKIKTQVERVLTIWGERAIYDTDLVDKLRGRLDLAQKKKIKEKELKEAAKEIAKTQAETPQRKPVPPDFKVSKLLVAIKKSTSLENDMELKHRKVEDLKIDASSFESVRHVKDRSSVGRFYKDFEESKVILENYCQTLSKASTDKLILMDLLDGGDAFYEAAQEEARVIVNAYKTFGNRLNSMKRKLDAKIKKLEEMESDISSYEPVVEPISDEDDGQDFTSQINNVRGNEDRKNGSQDMEADMSFSASYNEDSQDSADSQSQDSLEILETQDMDLDSASDEESSLVLTQPYDPASTMNISSDYGNDTNMLDDQPSNGMISEIDFMPQNTLASALQAQSGHPLLEGLTTGIPGLMSTDLKDSIIPGIQDNAALLGSLNDTLNSMLASGAPLGHSTKANVTIPPPVSMSAVLDNLFHGGLGKTVQSVLNNETQIISSEGKRSGGSTPVQDEGADSDSNQAETTPNPETKERPLQNLIDSLFPMLSKSLQTIKEKQAEVENDPDEKAEPDVTDAMMFALGENSEKDDVPRKKGKFVPFGSKRSPSPTPIVRSDISNSQLSSRIKARNEMRSSESVQIPGLGMVEEKENDINFQIRAQEPSLTPLQQLQQRRQQQPLSSLSSHDPTSFQIEQQPQSFYGDQPITHLMEPVNPNIIPQQQQGIMLQPGGLPIGHMPPGQLDPQLQQTQIPFGQLNDINVISGLPPGFILPSLPETIGQPVSSVQALDSFAQMNNQAMSFSTPGHLVPPHAMNMPVSESLENSFSGSVPLNIESMERNEGLMDNVGSNVTEGASVNNAVEEEWVEKDVNLEKGRDGKDKREKDHEKDKKRDSRSKDSSDSNRKESSHSSRKDSSKSSSDRKGSDRKKSSDEKRNSDERKSLDHKKASEEKKNSHSDDKKGTDDQKNSDEKDKKSSDDQRSSRRHRSRSPSDKKDGSSHRHSSSKHRSSNKDDDRKGKRSSSRSPSRRDSHRSSRDEKSSDRRKSSRQSSPHRRKSRGHRSSSKEKDRKRKHSPENTDPMYYNDRRSPTPEMDASSKKEMELASFQGDVGQFQGEVAPFQGEIGAFNQNVGQFNQPGQQLQILNPVLAQNPQLSNVPVLGNPALLPRGIQLMGMGGPRLLRPVTAEMIQHMKDQGHVLPQPIGKISKDGTLIPNNSAFAMSNDSVSSQGENTVAASVAPFSPNANLSNTGSEVGGAPVITTSFGTAGTETVTQILPNMAVPGVRGALSAAPMDLQKLLSGNLSLISNLPLAGDLRPRIPNMHMERTTLDMLPQLPPLEINSNLQKLLLRQPQPNFNQNHGDQIIRFDSPSRPNGQIVLEQALRPRFDKPPPIFEPPPRFDIPPPRFDVPPPRFNVPPPRFDQPPPAFDQSRPVGPPVVVNGQVIPFSGNPRPNFNPPTSQNIYDLPEKTLHRAAPDPLLDALEKANDSRREDLSIAELQARERKRSVSFDSDMEKAKEEGDPPIEDIRHSLVSPTRNESDSDTKETDENRIAESDSDKQSSGVATYPDVRHHPPEGCQPPEFLGAPQNDFRPRFDGQFENRPRFDGPPPPFNGSPFDSRPRFEGRPPFFDKPHRFGGPPRFDGRPRFEGRPRFRGRPRFEGRPRFSGERMLRPRGP